LLRDIRGVIELQPNWTSDNTPEMRERGLLVRRNIPESIRKLSAKLSERIGIPENDFGVEGRDGTGRKTEVPWVRYYSKSRSPHATDGWYCVLLFDALGSGVYLSVGHGSTTWTGTDFVQKPSGELARMVGWGRERLSNFADDEPSLFDEIHLESRGYLGQAYERSTVAAKFYSSDDLTDLEQFGRDLELFASMLGTIYRATALTTPPGETPPEVVEVRESASASAGKPNSRSSGAGFQPNAVQRKAIENRAMTLAKQKLQELGYTHITDTSRNRPYDYECVGPQGKITIEVKGTSSDGSSFPLTEGEVRHNRDVYPNNGLIVVSGMSLRSQDSDEITGGSAESFIPWDLSDGQLAVVSYIYRSLR